MSAERASFDPRDDRCRIPSHNGVGWYIIGHDCPGANNGVIADGNTRIEDGTSPDPHIVTDGDWLSVFGTFDALACREWMCSSVNVDARSHHAILTDLYPTNIQDNALKICIEILANVDIRSVVAPKRWFNFTLIATRSK